MLEKEKKELQLVKEDLEKCDKEKVSSLLLFWVFCKKRNPK